MVFSFIQNIWLSVTEISPRAFLCRQCLKGSVFEIYERAPMSHRHPKLYLKSEYKEEESCEGFIESPVTGCQSICLLSVRGSVLPALWELPPPCSRRTSPSRKPRSGGRWEQVFSFLLEARMAEWGRRTWLLESVCWGVGTWGGGRRQLTHRPAEGLRELWCWSFKQFKDLWSSKI